jgi:integrase
MEKVLKADAYVFHPGRRWNTPYTENRIRQIFQHYIHKAACSRSMARIGAADGSRCSRSTPCGTLISCTTWWTKGVPLPIVQKQVGHRSLKTTSVYLSASTEKMAQAYRSARQQAGAETSTSQSKTAYIAQ